MAPSAFVILVGMPLLNVDQAAEHLNLSVRHVRELVYRRRIPYVKLGRLVRFDLVDLDRWVQDNKRPAH